MSDEIVFSEDTVPFEWSETGSRKVEYGSKGAMLAALPRRWTPPFALIPAAIFAGTPRDGRALLSLGIAGAIEALPSP
jgi:hypothetical protein